MGRAVALSVLLALAALPARAVTCMVVVERLVVIDGPCRLVPYGDGGSFQIFSPDGGYFADVSIRSPEVAEGSWNGKRWASEALAPLGTLRRFGACWSNRRATICAW